VTEEQGTIAHSLVLIPIIGYSSQVKLSVVARRAREFVFLYLFAITTSAAPSPKAIHLRNETISPEPSSGQTRQATPANENPASGLFLIQFTETLRAEWRQQLETMGVQLLRYVPDDAFVADFNNVPPGQVRRLSFVQWIGNYRADHKLHNSFKTYTNSVAPNLVAVSVLISPRAAAADVASSRALMNSIEQESHLRAGTVLRGRISAARLNALANSRAVLWIEPAPQMKLFDEVASKIVAGDGGPNVLLSQSLGFDGSGVKVAVADSGLDTGDATTMHRDLFGRTPKFFYYGALTDASDEHSHGTHVAGIIAGDGAIGETDDNGALFGLGVAPGASIIAQRIFDGVGNFEPPPSFEKLTRDAKSAGADIGSNSWGDDTHGRYDISAMEFDELVRDADALTLGDQPYILEFSAGNAGPASQSIGSPAVAKNVIATGASQNDREDLFIYDNGPDAMADFSSRGPCEDGRIKPDLVAPGTWIASLHSSLAGDENAWLPISENYMYQGGTSQAGPHVSGAAAVFVQYYRQKHGGQTPSPALVKAALINSSVDMDDSAGSDPTPNMDEGWGRVDLTLLLDPGRKFDFVDQTATLTNSEVFERRLVVASADSELKITLAYTDVPGFPGAVPALVNDLDLEAIAPDGTLYRGNQFRGGESITNPAAADRINNVEGIFVSEPQIGEWILRVRAHNIVEDARVETEDVDQDFALVTSGIFAPAGTGVIALDRRFYRAPDQIKVRVADTDRAGSPNVSVTLTSTTESSDELKLLLPATTSGSFTGIVNVTTGAAVSNGVLQVSHGDTIQARYFDSSVGVQRIATATADLVAPVLSNVQTTNSFGRTIITWTSDEPANSIVRFGTNSVLNRSVTNNTLTSSHSIALSGLTRGQTYFFAVNSTDEAGNTATNNNGGALYSFVGPLAKPVLLVDGWQADYLFDPPPISGYTAPLDQLGVSYDVWDAGALGSPGAENLLPYRAVIWRFNEPYGWSTGEMLAISNYISSGGGFFLSSMEVMSRLEEAGATNFTTKVLQVQSYVTDPSSTGAAEVIGVPSGQIGAGLDIVMDYQIYDDVWGAYGIPDDASDTITPTANATAAFANDASDIVGLRWPAVDQTAQGKLVLFSFPLDAAPISDRVQLLRGALNFLAPGWNTAPDLTLDSPSYTIPRIVTVTLAGTSLTGLGSVNVTGKTDSATNGATFTLAETEEPGVFSGSFLLVSQTNPPAGCLRAKNGDTLTVNYLAGVNSHLIVTARVDTVAPIIAGVSSNASYESAVISWDTSKPADSLVQFGESALLGKTAFTPALDTSHEITLFGLQPSKTYYFQVVSRDEAGNTVVKSNNGQPFTFTTLQPLTPPWSDNMNSGTTNWEVFDGFADAGFGNTANWTLGVPNNTQETSAHSPPAAWGANLDGAFIEFADTYLISPAVYLTGGNIATLRFWHSYNFSPDEYELGTVYIFVGENSQPIQLAQYAGDQTPGWEEEVIDLSSYVGHVVYLVWNYQLFTLQDPPPPHPAWLVDDVSITVSNIPPGFIQITNNIWQAHYVLEGPTSRSGRGVALNITNAPVGPYTITWGDVAFYQTPPPQTNTLTASNTIVFHGNYTFVDANSNGISDAFEQYYFGSVSPGRTQQTDTDHDGVTDFAEWIEGTDPTNSASALRVTATMLQPGNTLRLRWNSVPDHAYRALGSTNLISWTPLSDWINPQAVTASFYVPATNRAANLFRLEVRP
jgi:hypothetical protein